MTVNLHTNPDSGRNETSRKKWRFYFLPFIFLFFSCASHPVLVLSTPEILPDTTTFIPEQFDWTPLCTGVDEVTCTFSSFPVRYHGIRIDLTTPELELVTFPASAQDFQTKNGMVTRFFTGKRTAAFARETKSTIAWNTSPFSGKSGEWNTFAKLTKTRQIVGVHKVQNIVFSPPAAPYAALTFTRTSPSGWTAHIIDSQSNEALAEAEYAFGGFFTILKNKVPQTFSWTSHDSRTAGGISSDGHTLFILVVEGENPFSSKGLSYPECAAVLLAMGASDALEFDGGGSSDLCINGRSVLSYPVLRTNAASAGFVLKSSRFH